MWIHLGPWHVVWRVHGYRRFCMRLHNFFQLDTLFKIWQLWCISCSLSIAPNPISRPDTIPGHFQWYVGRSQLWASCPPPLLSRGHLLFSQEQDCSHPFTAFQRTTRLLPILPVLAPLLVSVVPSLALILPSYQLLQLQSCLPSVSNRPPTTTMYSTTTP